MRKQTANTALLAVAFAQTVFGHAGYDALRVPEPTVGSSSICGITSRVLNRGILCSPDDPGGPGVTFTAEQQAKVNELIQREKAANKKTVDELTARIDALSTTFEAEKTKQAADLAEKERLAEEKALEGKSELEKLQHQLTKGTESQKKLKEESDRLVAEATTKAKAAETRLQDHVKRTYVMSALSAGVAENALDDATNAFLQNAQIEVGEDLKPTKIIYGGNVYDKPTEAGEAFFKERSFYAKAPPGGSGGPRNGGGAGGGKIDGMSGPELLGRGLKEPAYG